MHRSHRRGWRAIPGGSGLAVLGAAGAMVVGACATTGASTAPPATAAVVPEVHRGPQGDSGQFVVKCGFSHAATDDPIVHPGHAGASHRHDFFGNVATTSTSTAGSLLGGDTTCNHRLDAAAYWAPSLIDHGEPVTPLGSVIYYRPAPGVDPTTLVPYPTGLMMLSGDSTSTTPQPVEIAGWACGVSSDLRSQPQECAPTSPLQVRITFPDCWDGTRLDSPDHRAHVTYSQGGRCPEAHPVVMPQLTVTVRYPIAGPGHELTLASGSTFGAHADFLNAWDEHELTKQVDLCLHRDVVCNVASNRGQSVAIG
jgi:hypothetical protein